MKYSYEQRLSIVSRVTQGESISGLSKEYHINKTQLLAWFRMWKRYGRSGFVFLDISYLEETLIFY